MFSVFSTFTFGSPSCFGSCFTSRFGKPASVPVDDAGIPVGAVASGSAGRGMPASTLILGFDFDEELPPVGIGSPSSVLPVFPFWPLPHV